MSVFFIIFVNLSYSHPPSPSSSAGIWGVGSIPGEKPIIRYSVIVLLLFNYSINYT